MKTKQEQNHYYSQKVGLHDTNDIELALRLHKGTQPKVENVYTCAKLRTGVDGSFEFIGKSAVAARHTASRHHYQDCKRNRNGLFFF